MRKDEMRRELEALRAEVAALSASRKQQEAVASSAAGDSTKVPPAAEPPPEAGHSTHAEHKMKQQLDELFQLLERELRDRPTVTCLAVFSLGILFGRHLR